VGAKKSECLPLYGGEAGTKGELPEEKKTPKFLTPHPLAKKGASDARKKERVVDEKVGPPGGPLGR